MNLIWGYADGRIAHILPDIATTALSKRHSKGRWIDRPGSYEVDGNVKSCCN